MSDTALAIPAETAPSESDAFITAVLERMAAVDRNALRIGCYEMLYAGDIPTKVALNEAIELSKKFSTEASGAFVNGILDRIRKDQGLHA